ncbi:alpha/beta hydrolase [Bacillus sp. USDA818B3_A]|uniref:alpha/beta hydrolase n=1 Tax=Bacillus sp. USDA818B3_A TaxID=2698834 RepID=UPI001F3869E8|nr:alpha/beta hydrolase [Bacillus sp. USDA818B3_A]
MIRMMAISLAVLVICITIWNKAAAEMEDKRLGIKTISINETKENDVQFKPNIVYSKPGNKALNMHLLIPKNAPSPRPLIIYIKGGGWGRNHPQKTFIFIPQLVQFAKSGYVVASVEHRTSHEAKFPAQLYDIKAAIRYLKEHAEQYGIDSERVGVWGSSSGGHLAALVGTTGGVEQLEGQSGKLSEDSSVQAVVDWYGPTDFLQMSKYPASIDFDAPDSPESMLIGGPIQENEEKVKKANPITYITPDDPPFLIMHGDRDRRVPYNQSVLLYSALKKAHVEASMYKIQGAGHGGFARPVILNTVQAFFDDHLKKRR